MEGSDSTPEVTVQDLSDDLLLCVLKRLLPCPGLSVTAAALRNRQTYLNHIYACDKYLPQAHEPASIAWRSCLPSVGMSDALLESPPWRRGRVADRLYAATTPEAVASPPSMVCKRWRRIVTRSEVVKVAVCDLGERPPESTEVLVVASLSLWHDTGAGAAEQLSYVRDLPSLSALVLWCVAPRSGSAPRDSILTAPALPSGLEHLQHLVYVKILGRYHKAVLSGATVNSIRRLAGLRTLSLPALFPGKDGVPEMLQTAPLPQLRALDVPFYTDPAHISTAFTALRSLRLILNRDLLVGPRASNVVSEIDVAPLSHLSALDALALDCKHACKATGVGALRRLRHLELHEVHISDDSEGVFAALAALETLTIKRHSMEDIGESNCDRKLLRAVAGLRKPPRLSLTLEGTRVPELDYRSRSEVRRGCMPAGLSGAFRAQAAHATALLGALSGVTALCLSSCPWFLSDAKQLSAALRGLTGLRKLHLEECPIAAPEAMRCLTGLEDLWLEHSCSVGNDAAAWLDAMQLPQTCPGLKRLTLLGLDINDISGLRELEELNLYSSRKALAVLPQVLGLQHLRAVRLDGCWSVQDEHLQLLLGCKSLRFVSITNTGACMDSDEVTALKARGIVIDYIKAVSLSSMR